MTKITSLTKFADQKVENLQVLKGGSHNGDMGCRGGLMDDAF